MLLVFLVSLVPGLADAGPARKGWGWKAGASTARKSSLWKTGSPSGARGSAWKPQSSSATRGSFWKSSSSSTPKSSFWKSGSSGAPKGGFSKPSSTTGTLKSAGWRKGTSDTPRGSFWTKNSSSDAKPQKVPAATNEKARQPQRFFSPQQRDAAFEGSKDKRGIPRCEYCGTEIQRPKGSGKSYEADHRKPYVLGGLSNSGNLAPSCRDCNRQKGKNELYKGWIPPKAR